MITNILAAVVVSVVTNVTTGDNGIPPQYSDMWPPKPGVEATEKWEITEVRQVTEIKFGGVLGLQDQRQEVVLSRNIRRWTLDKQWKANSDTNEPIQAIRLYGYPYGGGTPNYFISTNILGIDSSLIFKLE